MTKIIDLLLKRKHITPTKGDIGVEIEVEGLGLVNMGKFWTNEKDGSLHGESMEYVLAKPSSIEEVSQALRYMDGEWTRHKTVIHEAIRAGVHVHINCQQLTIKQLYSFMTLFLVFENVLVKFSGVKREGNLFCLRSKDAEYMLDQIVGAVADKREMLGIFHTDLLRYAAMNVKALGDYGSLEFRTMRSSRDLGLIYTWVEMLFGLRKYVEANIDKPSQIIEKFSLGGPVDLGKEVFAEHWDVLKNQYADLVSLERALHEGMRNAQEVAYCVEDWDEFDSEVVKRVNGVVVDPNNENEPEEDF